MGMIVGVTGFMRAGKDSIANVLIEEFGFVRHGFADTLKQMAYDINPVIATYDSDMFYLAECVDEDGWEYVKDNYPEARRFLQRLGTEGARKNLGDNIWVEALMRRLSDPIKNYVIPDTRFLNEARAIRSVGGEIWRVERPGCEATGHASESEMLQINPDLTIVNDGTLEELSVLVKGAVKW